MNLDIKIKKVENTKNTKYDMSIKTYKESISGTFEKEDLRFLIQTIDNEII
jgi:hypothetical protein